MKKTFLLGVLPFLLLGFPAISQVQSQLISVNDRNVEYKISGLEDRKLYQPIVILESGLLENLTLWDQVFEQVSEFSPVLSYNRAGVGKSELSNEEISISSRVKELKELLDEMEIEPPYVLVGNNWGTLINQEFLANYPNEVIGTLYLDPIITLDNQENLAEYFNQEGFDGELLSGEYIEFLKSKSNVSGNMSEKEKVAFLSLLEENKVNWETLDESQRQKIVMLGRRNDMFPMMGRLSMDSREFYKKLIAGKVDYFEENLLDQQNASLVLSSGSMNFLPYQESVQIATTIQNLIFADVNSQIMEAARSLDKDSFQEYLDGLETYVPASLLKERSYNMLGYSLMRMDLYEQAVVLFQKNLGRHPSSANVYDSYGDGLLATGKIEEAIPYFEKAIELGAKESHRDLELFKKNLAKSKEMMASQN